MKQLISEKMWNSNITSELKSFLGWKQAIEPNEALKYLRAHELISVDLG